MEMEIRRIKKGKEIKRNGKKKRKGKEKERGKKERKRKRKNIVFEKELLEYVLSSKKYPYGLM